MISIAYQCLLLWPISIVGGAFEQKGGEKKYDYLYYTFMVQKLILSKTESLINPINKPVGPGIYVPYDEKYFFQDKSNDIFRRLQDNAFVRLETLLAIDILEVSIGRDLGALKPRRRSENVLLFALFYKEGLPLLYHASGMCG